MIQRISVRDNETADTARRRFDGQLDVRAWATPSNDLTPTSDTDTRTPWWWNKAEADQSTQVFMEMARAKGMV